MKRLTERHTFELRGFGGKQYNVSTIVLKSTGQPAGNDEIAKVYNKLAEFEDFMEKYKFESWEDFQNSIGFIRFSDGYDDNGNEMHKQEFVKYLDAYQERVKYSKKLYQDKKQLQDRWEQLKKFTKDKISCLSKMDGLGEFVVAYELILDKMQELEKE